MIPAFLVGVTGGLRAMMPLAAVAWGVRAGVVDPGGGWLAWLAAPWAPWVLTLLAVAELFGDQHPATPSRTVPMQFGTRVVTGALAGAAMTAAEEGLVGGAVAGLAGAVAGTFGGRALRARLATAFGRDRPAALIEDAIAIGIAGLALTLR